MVAVVAIAVTGVLAIWGDSVAKLFGRDAKKTERKLPEPTVPGGSAAGPF
jgi:hypothetical protein